MPLRQPMPVLFVGEPNALRFAPVQGKPAPQLAGPDVPSGAEWRCAYMVKTPWLASGTGIPSENTDRMRVFTITITAPQHVQRIGARSLNHGKARSGANFSSTCSKAIRRFQFGCRKPKLRATNRKFNRTTRCGRVAKRGA